VTLILSRLRLQTAVDTRSDRRVSWLELFFDLVFVAAVAQVAEPLREHYGPGELARLAPLLLLIWWAWTGRAMFATRFDADDGVQRALTIFEMFAIAVMAANARESLGSRSSAGFAAAYAGVRVILLIHYLRASGIREARDLMKAHVIGHGVAAALWLGSALLPVTARIVVWMAAFALDLATPWAAVDHSVRTPPHPAHLPERFGLFTLILLGESVVAVMKGIESQETWSVTAASSALVGMGILFAIWWWYFDRIGAAGERRIRTRADAVRMQVWSDAHFPLYLSIVIIGVGIRRMVTAATHEPISSGDVAMWLVGGSLLFAAMSTIAATIARNDRPGLKTRAPQEVMGRESAWG
jgi:low temperature requirement protein LtrA